MLLQQTFLVGGLIGWAVYMLYRTGRRAKYLPPGPPTLPLIGNLHLFPNTGQLHLKFTEWARQYGDVISLKAASHTIIVLSSATSIRKSWTRWAGSQVRVRRTICLMISVLCSDGLHIVFTGSTPELKTMRKAIATFFSRQNAAKRSPIPAESAQLLYELMDNPSKFSSSVRRFTHSTIKTLVYGQRAAFFDSEAVTKFYESMDECSRVNSPGVCPPIDLIPVLKCLPAKLAPWYAPARAVERVRRQINEELYENVLKKMQTDQTDLGPEPEWKCWTQWMIETNPELKRDFVSYTGLVLIDGGSDTSGAYLLSLILALALNPEYQERAWKEVDAVVGERIPERADLEDMPFVQALMKEILRLRSPFTMGFPHSMAGDVFGHVLPKGSTIMLNNYVISTDPEVFEDPEAFKPERFLKTEHGTIPGRDKDFRDSFIFGGGRRICPVQFVAQYTAELMTMCLIWALQFGNAVDAKTKKIIAPGLSAEHYDFELVVSSRPFECFLIPRAKRAQMLKDDFLAATVELQKYEVDLAESDKKRLRELRAKLS